MLLKFETKIFSTRLKKEKRYDLIYVDPLAGNLNDLFSPECTYLGYWTDRHFLSFLGLSL